MKILTLKILSRTTGEDSLTQLFFPTCKIIVSEHFCIKGRRQYISSTKVPGIWRTFTGYFFGNLLSSMPHINESPVVKIAFRTHLQFWSLALGVITGDRFEGDEIYVTFLWWDCTPSFCIVRFCVWVVLLRTLRGIDDILHRSKLY